MTVVKFQNYSEQSTVYIVLGIDEHSHDQVLAVFNSYNQAKKFLVSTSSETLYYDLWIEKHSVM